RTFNQESCVPPKPDKAVITIAKSAWAYEEKGLNRFGKTGAYITTNEVNRLLKTGSMDAVALVTLLRARNGPNSRFLLVNGFHKTLGWGRERSATARKHLVATGIIHRESGNTGYFRFTTGVPKIEHPSSKDTTYSAEEEER